MQEAAGQSQGLLQGGQVLVSLRGALHHILQHQYASCLGCLVSGEELSERERKKRYRIVEDLGSSLVHFCRVTSQIDLHFTDRSGKVGSSVWCNNGLECFAIVVNAQKSLKM